VPPPLATVAHGYEVELDDGLDRDRFRSVVDGAPIGLSRRARERMLSSQAALEDWIEGGGRAYGVTSGVGDLAAAEIASADRAALQLDLVRSHRCGVGDPLDGATVRGGIASRAANLARGYSGVRPDVVDLLCELLNRRVCPVVPARGSVGASGDPILLAHVASVLVGEGEATVADGPPMPGGDALGAVGLAPIALQSREGLALLNGLDFSTASSDAATRDARRALDWAGAITALSLEVLRGSPEPFLEQVQLVRGAGPHVDVARDLLQRTLGSRLLAAPNGAGPVQDPYCLRCVPQVHGAVAQAIAHVESLLEAELQAVVDNPLTFAAENAVRHCGHFHGQALSLGCDYLALAVVTIANLAHARTSLLLRGTRGLPAMLAERPGVDSGLMMLETTSASLVGRARAEAAPVSVHSIPASSIQEDHVSMAWESSRRTRRLSALVAEILAVEALAAAAAASIRGPEKLGAGSRALYDALLPEHGEVCSAGPALTERLAALVGPILEVDPPAS
jgi:histidine ammonia-lyase